jgi:hypothetical protein
VLLLDKVGAIVDEATDRDQALRAIRKDIK